MDLDLGQLRALRAAVDAGTLEGAARALQVTPSAVSQRLKALEQATGRVLLVRSRPVRVTEQGRAVLRLAREVELLAADTARELTGDAGPVTLPVAVNADSLATWLVPALAPLAGEVLLDLHRADQDDTAALLRDGTVVAAVTTAAAAAVPGCRATPLGVLRYRPAAAPGFVRRWFPDGPTPAALARAPVVHFDREDALQREWLRRRARADVEPPAHRVPSTEGFVQAVLAGLGWAVLSDLQLADPALREAVVLLDPDAVVDVPLHWQRWRLRSPSLERLTDVVLAGGRRALLQR